MVYMNGIVRYTDKKEQQGGRITRVSQKTYIIISFLLGILLGGVSPYVHASQDDDPIIDLDKLDPVDLNPTSVAASTTTTPQIGPQVNVFTPAAGNDAATNPPSLLPSSNTMPSITHTIPIGGGSLRVPFATLAHTISALFTNPILSQANIILGKWKSLIEQNVNAPNKITKPDAEINKDRTIIESLLRSHKDLPEATRQEYLLLLDLFKLAQIRNFNNTLSKIKAIYPESITTQETDGPFDIKDSKKSSNPYDYDRRDTGNKVVYGIYWYQKKLSSLQSLLTYFKEPLTKMGTTPPLLLTGIRETMTEAESTYEQYKWFTTCLANPGTDSCRAFINIIQTQSNANKKNRNSGYSGYSSRSSYDDNEDDYSDFGG